ncbi:hypothetical protein [Rhodococcoides fascians]|uniref:hypothetical protein n=1 Tax=Rhodococcoides fascians TaxID=1828 RepID=UPI0012FDF275|nr:hypothetical protein [Rhodococcus fascians]
MSNLFARGEQRIIETLLVQEVVSLNEARRLRTPGPADPFLRDAVDNLAMDLTAHSLGDAGPSSVLEQLERFGSAVAQSLQECRALYPGKIGQAVFDGVLGITRENRAERRWLILGSIGAPAADHREAAMHTWVRVLVARVTDGLLHPVLGAQQIASVGPLSVLDGYDSRETQVNRAATQLYLHWRTEVDTRSQTEQKISALFNSLHWRA